MMLCLRLSVSCRNESKKPVSIHWPSVSVGVKKMQNTNEIRSDMSRSDQSKTARLGHRRSNVLPDQFHIDNSD